MCAMTWWEQQCKPCSCNYGQYLGEIGRALRDWSYRSCLQGGSEIKQCSFMWKKIKQDLYVRVKEHKRENINYNDLGKTHLKSSMLKTKFIILFLKWLCVDYSQLEISTSNYLKPKLKILSILLSPLVIIQSMDSIQFLGFYLPNSSQINLLLIHDNRVFCLNLSFFWVIR